jgi:hypothetical protein
VIADTLLLVFLVGGYGSIAVFGTRAVVREERARRGRTSGH